MLSEKAELERLYEELYRSHQQAAKEASLRGEDYEQYLLEEYDLRVFQHPEMLEPLPETIRIAYAPYAENLAYWARLCKVPYEETYTFAICVTTDGDDGYLEIYSKEGTSISAGRTYLELIGWCSLDELRHLSRPDVLAYPASLEGRMKQTLWNSER